MSPVGPELGASRQCIIAISGGLQPGRFQTPTPLSPPFVQPKVGCDTSLRKPWAAWEAFSKARHAASAMAFRERSAARPSRIAVFN